MSLLNLSGMNNKGNEKAEKAVRDLDTANFRINQLENQFRELSLTNQALWELLKNSASLPDTALQDKVDAMQQALQERANQTATCSACSRTVPADKPSCYYCGAQLQHENQTHTD